MSTKTSRRFLSGPVSDENSTARRSGNVVSADPQGQREKRQTLDNRTKGEMPFRSNGTPDRRSGERRSIIADDDDDGDEKVDTKPEQEITQEATKDRSTSYHPSNAALSRAHIERHAYNLTDIPTEQSTRSVSASRPRSSSTREVEQIQQRRSYMADHAPFTILTDVTCQTLVEIPLEEFGKRIEYLLKHRDLLEHNRRASMILSDLYNQSIEFARMKEALLSTACILSLALIHTAKQQQVATLSTFFARLREDDTCERDGFREMSEKLREIVTTQATRRGPIAASVRSINAVSRSNTEARQRTKLTTEPISQDQHDDEDESTGDALSEIVMRSEQDNEKIGYRSRNIADISGENSEMVSSAVDPARSENLEIRKLSSAYRLRSGSWFRTGKVFAIVWHEAAGEVKKTKKRRPVDELMEPREHEKLLINTSLSSAPYESTVFTHVRRMVVIRNRHGSCWCVPIGTYGGRGLCKRGLSEADINAHTVIYDTNKSPIFIGNEPRSSKRPIGVKLASGVSLDPASRIHLAKPYSVEWNLKVMDCGDVVREDLPALVAYVKDALFGDI